MNTLKNRVMIPGSKREIVAAVVLVLAGIGLTLFAHWEPTTETWVCWLFARIFAQTGKFIMVGRGPLYSLYLNMFSWIGYPTAVIIEYVATSLILAVSLVALCKRQMGLFWAAFAVFLWLPFFQFAEPPTQKLALAFSCLAIALRDGVNIGRFRKAVSYALLGLTCMLRSTYIVFLVVVIIYDSVNLFRRKRLKDLLTEIRPVKHGWPILLVLILLVWFNAMQSPHRWNNAAAATTTWFPHRSESLADAAFIHHYNALYINKKYVNSSDADFYITNKELFKGADTMLGAIRANPRFVAEQFLNNNLKGTIGLTLNFTMLPRVYKLFSGLGYVYYIVAFILTIGFICAFFYGIFLAFGNKNIALFIVANFFLLLATTIIVPKERYMFPLVPILVLSAFWLGRRTQHMLAEKKTSSKMVKRLFMACSYVAIPLFLVLFSNGRLIGANWGGVIGDIARDFKSGKVRIMEDRPYSNKASFKSIRTLTKDCNGMLSNDNQLFGAFLDVPMDKIYDIWEIPPFGSLSDSSYKGLHPERIDCVLVSHDLATERGSGTNFHIRYQNYIKPYIEQLKEKGARVYDIETYGQLVILPQKNK